MSVHNCTRAAWAALITCPWRGQENRKGRQPRGVFKGGFTNFPIYLWDSFQILKQRGKKKKERKKKEPNPGLGKINHLHCTICDVSGWFVTVSSTVRHEQHWKNNPQQRSWLQIASKTISRWTITSKFSPFYKHSDTKKNPKNQWNKPKFPVLCSQKNYCQREISSRGILTGNELAEIILIFFF